MYCLQGSREDQATHHSSNTESSGEGGWNWKKESYHRCASFRYIHVNQGKDSGIGMGQIPVLMFTRVWKSQGCINTVFNEKKVFYPDILKNTL